jgi:signal peptidase
MEGTAARDVDTGKARIRPGSGDKQKSISKTNGTSSSSLERKNDKEPKKGLRPVLTGALGVVRDIAVSAGIVALILVSLFAYTGVWPPMVVIESNSMMHGGDSEIGVIDTGDLTLVKSINERHDVVTYVEATCATNPHHGFKSYGDFGNVIVYRKNGLTEIPVIHRAIAWIEYNATASNPPYKYVGNIPDIGVYNVTEYTLNKAGYQNQNIRINLDGIFRSSAVSTSRAAHSGFVTHGDHNPPQVDQESLRVQQGSLVEPVKVNWVVGRAEGELPWFGLFKLWITGHDSSIFPPSSTNGLITTVFLLIAVPISVDFAVSLYKKRQDNRKDVPKRVKKRILKEK